MGVADREKAGLPRVGGAWEKPWCIMGNPESPGYPGWAGPGGGGRGLGPLGRGLPGCAGPMEWAGPEFNPGALWEILRFLRGGRGLSAVGGASRTPVGVSL